MATLTISNGKSIKLGKELGAGGEGAVYNIVGAPKLVAKIYHDQRINAALETKLRTMVAVPPDDATRQPPLNHVSITWPIDIVLRNGKFCGYIMPKLPKSDNLYDLLQPQQRAKQHGQLNHRHLYRTARNLAIALDAIHQKGYVVGDVNFKNALFNDDALITLVDCDSMQVTDSKGVVHHCLVGVPEYTPPELQGQNFATVTRTANHDAFGLAVLIFQLLMQGFHPFAGRPTAKAPDVEQSHIYCISQRIFPYLDGQAFVPPKAAPALQCLPGVLRIMFERAFTQINNRPTPKEWATVIALVESRLVPCGNDPHHFHPSDGQCVICEVDYNVGKRKRTTPKPSAQTSAQQVPLKPQQPQQPPAPAVAKTSTSSSTSPMPPARPVTTSLPPLPQTPPSQAAPQSRPNALWRSVIPVVVIVMALWWMGQNISAFFGSPAPAAVATATPASVATATALPATATVAVVAVDNEPTATTAAVAPVVCTADAMLAAVWPQINPNVRNGMIVTPFSDSLSTRYQNPIQITGFTNATDIGQTWQAMADTCTGNLIQYSHPLQSDTAGYVGCTTPDCGLAATTTSVRDYALVLRNPKRWPTLNIDSSDALMRQFANGVTNASNAVRIAIVSDRSTTAVMQQHLLPLIQRPLVTMRYNKAFWVDQGKSSIQTITNAWPQTYDETIGVVDTSAPAGSKAVVRTVTLPANQWSNGQLITTADYVNWWQGCAERNDDHPACTSIIAIEARDSQTMQLRYLPGLPQAIADMVAPLAVPANATDIWQASIGEWRITRLDRATFKSASVEAAQIGRIDIQIYTSAELQPLQDAVRQNTIDLVIIDTNVAGPMLSAFATTIPVSAYTWELVPTGGLYLIQ